MIRKQLRNKIPRRKSNKVKQNTRYNLYISMNGGIYWMKRRDSSRIIHLNHILTFMPIISILSSLYNILDAISDIYKQQLSINSI